MPKIQYIYTFKYNILKKLTVLFTLLITTILFAQDPKVIVITMDGVRWKEVFRGAEKSILDNEK